MQASIAAVTLAIGVVLTLMGGHRNGPAPRTTPGPIKKWEHHFDSPPNLSSPAVSADGTIYVGTQWGLYAIAADGRDLWHSAYMNVTSSPMIAPDGTIYVAELYGRLHAFNPDGTRVWQAPGQIRASVYNTVPALGLNQAVYLLGGGINAFSAGDGTLLWQVKQRFGLQQLMAVSANGVIIIGSDDGQCYALHPDGETYWVARIRNGRETAGAAIGPDGVIYIGSDNGTLYAVFDDGQPKFELKLPGPIRTEPVIAQDGTIYLSGDRLYAIAPDGKQKWSFTPEAGGFTSSPALAADGTIYAGAGDGRLYAVRVDGSKKWDFPTGAAIHAAPNISSDGTVYALNVTGHLYALTESNGGLMHSAWPRFQHDEGNTGNVGAGN